MLSMKTLRTRAFGASLILSGLLIGCSSDVTSQATAKPQETSTKQPSPISQATYTTYSSRGSKVDTYPQTPNLNARLPIIHTHHGSDYIKANVLNPHPVCNALEDYRTVIYKITDHWLPVGTLATSNNTNNPIPLTQSTSRSQTISLSINGSQNQTVSGSLGGSGKGVQGNIAFSLAKIIGGQASFSLTWNAGQQIGPYQVPAGHTGEATYGFHSVHMTGTQQFCQADGTWSNTIPWIAHVPLKNEVRVNLYKDLTDAALSDKEKHGRDIIPLPQPAQNVSMEKPTEQQTHDLEPYLTVSDIKAVGYAGSVALHIKNVGSKRYYDDSPVVSFLVEIKTESGPEGVDRLITPNNFGGAYTQDLGFDKNTSTHSYLVSLANPIESKQSVMVTSFAFGDGGTREGRLNNYIRISQIGRLDNDTSYYNDTLVDSRKTTLNDFNKPHKYKGLF